MPLPAGGGGSGQIAVVTYDGQTYTLGQVPPLPPLDLASYGECGGEVVSYPPYVCADADGQGVYVRTCVVSPCRTEYVRHGDYTENVVEFLARVYDDPVEAVCRSRC